MGLSLACVVELSRGQIVAWAVAAALVVVAGVRLLAPGAGSPAPAPVRLDSPATGSPRGKEGLYVHVAGAVRRPGLYRLPASARVAVALERAGGPKRRADLAAINLAATVEDGQQIRVPRAGERPAAPGEPGGGGATGGAGGSTGAKLSLASATVDQLDQLDGIGPTLAKRIVEYREKEGGFKSVEELREVEGIGEKRFAALREAVGP